MTDVLDFASPLGPLGRMIDSVILAGYMRRFLESRGQELKRIAEAEPIQ